MVYTFTIMTGAIFSYYAKNMRKLQNELIVEEKMCGAVLKKVSPRHSDLSETNSLQLRNCVSRLIYVVEP